MMRNGGLAALTAMTALASGCFQEEAPRHEAPAAVAAASAITQADVPELAAILVESDDPDVRREAIYAIADADETDDTAIIGEALYDPDGSVRLSAIKALTGVRGETSADWLSIALGDPDPLIRQTAVEALGEIGGDTAQFLLQQALADVDPRVREAAQQMLDEPAQAIGELR